MSEWYRGSVEIVDSRTLKVTLPDGMKVTPGQPVPPEILEMMAAYLRLRNENVLNEAEGCGVQLGRAAEACGVQLGKTAQPAEGCVLQFGRTAQPAEGCLPTVTQLGKALPAAEGCYQLFGRSAQTAEGCIVIPQRPN
jgi:hypothetical protein